MSGDGQQQQQPAQQPTKLAELKTDQHALAKKKPENFPQMLETWKGEIARALPRHLSADRMARVALTSFRNVPKLAECNPLSVFAAVLQAAQLGIEPGLMGEAHLIPYGDTCQLIPGYQGLIKLAKQTGQVVDIYAMAVRDKDKFRCTFGINRDLVHDPLAAKGGFPASLEARGEIIGFYAVAVFKDGTRTFVVMGKDEVDLTRDNSSGWQSAKRFNKEKKHPWHVHYEAMGNKTAIRRLCKMLPKSPELAQALALEETHDRGKAQNIDMGGVLDGSYAPSAYDDGDVIDVDAETGEIKQPHGQSQGQQQQQQPQGGRRGTGRAKNAGGNEGQQQQQPQQAQNNTGPSISDVLALVRAEKYEDATALVGGTGFSDIDRKEISVAIDRHKKGEDV